MGLGLTQTHFPKEEAAAALLAGGGGGPPAVAVVAGDGQRSPATVKARERERVRND